MRRPNTHDRSPRPSVRSSPAHIRRRGVLAGIGTALPAGVTLAGLDTDPMRTPDLPWSSWSTTSGPRTGRRLRQVVYTATQFPDIETVALYFGDGGAPVVIADGTVLDAPLSRSDFFGQTDRLDLLAPIFVGNPPVNGVVGSPFEITGVANVFEAQLGYELDRTDGSVLASGNAMAHRVAPAAGATSRSTSPTKCPRSTLAMSSSTRRRRRTGLASTRCATSSRSRRTPATAQAATPVQVLADVPGNPPLDGLTVVTSPLTIYGNTAKGAEIRVNGQIVPVTGGSWEDDHRSRSRAPTRSSSRTSSSTASTP